MKILNDILKELKQANKINAEISNQNLDIIAGLELIRKNTNDIRKNTYKGDL